MKNIIYGLRDPRNDVYQYIGKSTVGINSPIKHLFKSHSEKVNNWVNYLSERFIYPEIDIIEEVEELYLLAEREKYWIEYYKEINPDLLNMMHNAPLNSLLHSTEETNLEFEDLIRTLVKAGTILKRERLFRGISQEEMGKLIGMARSTVSLCENSANVTINCLKKYALILKEAELTNKTVNTRASRKKTK